MPLISTATLLRLTERLPGPGRWAATVFYRAATREAAVELVAIELDYNAATVASGLPPEEVADELQLNNWHSYQRDVIIATRRYPGVRQAVVAAYSDLQRAAAGTAHAPSKESLQSAAARLRDTNR